MPRLPAVLAVTACLLAPACGGGDDTPADVDARTPDAPVTTPDAEIPDAGAWLDGAPCDGALCWVEEYERETLGKLAGAAEITPGVTLAHRTSDAEREHARVYLESELRRWGLSPTRQTYGDGGGNVLATLPATDGATGPLVVIGAHFDGVSAGPAAADDGTGTALVLALARHLAALPTRTRPVLICFWDQEELGLLGSHETATQLFQAGTAVAEVHNFDMISYDGDGDGAVELWEPSAAMLARYQAVAQPLGIPIEPVEDFAYSDHQSFVDRGFSTVGVSEEFVNGDHTPHYHEPTDTVANVNFGYLAHVTELAAAAVSAGVTP